MMGTVCARIRLSNPTRPLLAPVDVQFENRFTTAMVPGDEVLLGAIPMQDMDVLIDPRDERLIVPPDRPNFALSKVK